MPFIIVRNMDTVNKTDWPEGLWTASPSRGKNVSIYTPGVFLPDIYIVFLNMQRAGLNVEYVDPISTQSIDIVQ